ncbi:unnamed protein product [Hermetia illucens]|uniref:Uncharacterized protein n=3 Tax=Hermetia illucens TaxID=343691 RepID=A0A7R8UDM2_HERIL|nr:5'-nucleotidase isoform X2 [Hermetia illucens]XP_037917548.1 5'-nucleotidase isoform X2 [Hermetia illucens]CAD7078007.1 unnamed protein product [Hermetia illucens]
MAGFASQAALRSKWGDLVESGSTALPEASEVTQGLKNVVGWLKQASIEVREAGKRAVTQLQSTNPSLIASSSFDSGGGEDSLSPDNIETKPKQKSVNISPISQLEKSKILSNMTETKPLTILHYNDVYNIEPNSTTEPIGGAARFCTAMKSFKDSDPLVLFSGDAFSPSMLSTYTNGEQMVPVLNAVGTHCAVFGNHDFDHGLDVLMDLSKKTEFPWLMSNVVDNETGRPLGGGKITHFLYHNQTTIGLIGLVEREWLETLPTIDPKEVTYIDFVKAGNQLAEELRNEGCEIVIALTHMRTPNDVILAQNCSNIDLILGGHDHVFEITKVNNIHIIKSGTDFRQFSKISIDKDRDEKGKIQVKVEEVNVTSDYEEDKELSAELAKYSEMIESKMTEVLGTFSVELDGRFSKIRTSETNLGDWVCDVVLSATGADVVMINSGTFRSDQIHPPGPFTMKDLVNIIPMRDPLIVIEISGKVLLAALENSVCNFPKLEGRFPQVSGMTFAFDPSKPAGQRVDSRLVQIADEWLNLDQIYKVCIKNYMYLGCDGYTMFKDASRVVMDDDSCPELGLAIQNHFKAIDVRMGKGRHSKHRQSLVTLSRRHSMVQMLDNLDLDGPSPIRKLSLAHRAASIDHTTSSSKMLRRASLDDLEQVSCQLAPAVQHRIIEIKNEEHFKQLLLKRESLVKNSIIAEADDE